MCALARGALTAMAGAPPILLLLLGALCAPPATAGLHVFQRMGGCELRDDGSIGGFDQFAYDGRDFVSFDKENMKYTAATDEATVTADTWNKEESLAQRNKVYLEDTCIEWLQKYLNYGKESLLRRVPPQTMISRGKTGAATTLTCFAYGFYPREIEVKWMRNEVEVDWKTKTILPNTDGTYQIRSTVELLICGHDVKNYRCLVDHISLEEIITVVYEEKSGTLYIWLIGGAIAVALVALGVAAAVIWKKKHPGKETYSSVRRAPEPDHGGGNAEAAAQGGQRSSLSGHQPISAQRTGV